MTRVYFVRQFYCSPYKRSMDTIADEAAFSGGESIAMVQKRNIEALNEILSESIDKEIVVGTHGTALSTILNFYDNDFVCEDFFRIIDWMPYIIELDFEGNKLVGKRGHCYVEKEFKRKQRENKNSKMRVTIWRYDESGQEEEKHRLE